MSNKLYRIDFKKLAVLLLPTFLRSAKIIAWFKVTTSGLKGIHYEFLKQRDEDLYRLAHNGQVCYLRKVLNDQFDPDKRRITIEDGGREIPQYIYTDGEQKPIWLGTMWIYPSSKYSDNGIDFIVKLPIDVWETQKIKIDVGEYRHYKVESLVDFYALATKRYIIEIL